MEIYDPISMKSKEVKTEQKSEEKNTPPPRVYLPEMFMYITEISKKGIIKDISIIYEDDEISVAIVGIDGYKYWWDNKLSKEEFKPFIKGVVADVITRCLR